MIRFVFIVLLIVMPFMSLSQSDSIKVHRDEIVDCIEKKVRLKKAQVLIDSLMENNKDYKLKTLFLQQKNSELYNQIDIWKGKNKNKVWIAVGASGGALLTGLLIGLFIQR